VGRPADRHRDGTCELPACAPLAELLQVVEAADRANARAVELLARLHATGEAEAVTGVAVETWLLSRGVPASDRRMLATAASQLSRLPSVADGSSRGVVSWGQVRTISLLTERLSAGDATEFDLALAPSIDRYADADPDGLLQIARQIVDRLRPDHAASEVERVERERFISMQPRLDGTGGRFHGDLDGLGFGLVAAALGTGAPLPERRHDRIGADPTTDRNGMVRLGAHRADRLVQLCADDLARRGAPFDTGAPLAANGPTVADDEAGMDRTRALAPEALLVLDQDQLLSDDGLPVELITKLTGGRLKVAGPTARRWLDQAGGRFRTVVLDETGQVLGVGRRTRIPPGWLSDARLATDATCRAPGCRTAAAACDDDHHRPWHPARPSDRPGTTAIDNVGPGCRTDNTIKERQGWTLHPDHDGTVVWDHPRSGMRLRTLPWATTRAAARPPRTRDPDPPDGGHDPPPF
jgi:hypothetical protein